MNMQEDYMGYNENTKFTNYGHKRTPYSGHKSIFNAIIAEHFLNFLGGKKGLSKYTRHNIPHTYNQKRSSQVIDF
ncbi:hypothetical protein ACQP3F_33090, partial [Escherichia coli]